jgi:hypothetical protein
MTKSSYCFWKCDRNSGMQIFVWCFSRSLFALSTGLCQAEEVHTDKEVRLHEVVDRWLWSPDTPSPIQLSINSPKARVCLQVSGLGTEPISARSCRAAKCVGHHPSQQDISPICGHAVTVSTRHHSILGHGNYQSANRKTLLLYHILWRCWSVI